MVRPRTRSTIFAMALVAAHAPVFAQEAETFPRVYAWETPPNGWFELSIWHTVVANSNVAYNRFGLSQTREGLIAQSLEVEYGLTDRAVVAVYGDVERPENHAIAFTQARIEARYRLFDRYERLLNPTLYVEYYFPREAYGAPEHLEARLILERDFGDLRFDLNPVLTKTLSGPEVTERSNLGFAAGIYYRRFYWIQPGVEVFWNMGPIGEAVAIGRHWILISPSIDVYLQTRLYWHVAAGIGATDGSDRLLLRSYLTFEFETVRPSSQQMAARSTPLFE
jgi:hypothetical protein